jgi:AcrR family transcriptional regulator
LAIQNDPDLRQKIMQVFRESAEEKGLRETLMLDVANKLKISKKTIYKFFASKDEMIWELVRGITTDIGSLIRQTRHKGETPLEKPLENLIGIHARVSRYILNISPQLLLDIQTDYPELWGEIEKCRERNSEIFREIIESGIGSGVFKPVNVTVAVRIIAASISGVVNPQFLNEHQISFEESLNSLQTLVIEGLKT